MVGRRPTAKRKSHGCCHDLAALLSASLPLISFLANVQVALSFAADADLPPRWSVIGQALVCLGLIGKLLAFWLREDVLMRSGINLSPANPFANKAFFSEIVVYAFYDRK